MGLAAHLLGVASIWKSASVRTGAALAELFEMGPDEKLMGWVNLGTAAVEPRPKANPVGPAEVAARLVDGALEPWGQSPSGQE